MTIDDRTLNHFLNCKYKEYLSACGTAFVMKPLPGDKASETIRRVLHRLQCRLKTFIDFHAAELASNDSYSALGV
jgi:hypothetical protein